MVQIIPQSDPFTETATPVDGFHCGYARFLPWSGAEGASGDSLVSNVGDLNSAYSNALGSPPRASVMNAGTLGTGLSHFLWSRSYVANAEARLAVLWKPSPNLTSSSFRYAMVGVRCSGQTVNDATPGAERLEGGSGYWLLLRNTASANTAKWVLLRVNSGTVTKLTESAAFDISTLPLGGGLILILRATTSGSTVVLKCQRGAIGKFGIKDPNPVDVFGADFVDSSGSRITAAGRCGLGMPVPPLGGATLSSTFQIRNIDTDTIEFADEWTRANLLVAGSVGPDQNTAAGRNLMPYFGGSIGGYAGVSRRLVRDAGNNRMRNEPSVGLAWDCPMAIAATHPAVQRRYGLVTFSTPSGQTDVWSIELRMSGGHGIGAPLSGYRAEIECASGTTFTARVASYAGGTRTVLASKVLASLSTGTAIKFEFETVNTRGTTPLLGIPNLIVRVNDSVVSGWTSAGVAGILIESSGAILDARTAAIRTGSEQGHRYLRTGGVVGTILLDDWTDAATLPEPSTNDLAQILLQGETHEFSGQTLTVPVSFKVEQTPSDPGLWHEYETKHRQTIAEGSRIRRRWKLHNPAATAAEEAALIDFHDDHKGTQVWFLWKTDDGDTARVHFLTEKLVHRMRDAGARAFEFELEEGFLS